MGTCINGHLNESDAKFCGTCGAASTGSAPSTGVTAPSTGFRSTMKNTPAAQGNTGLSAYGTSGYTTPATPTYPAPTYMPPATPPPVYGGPVYTMAAGPAVFESRPSVKGMAIAGMVLGIIADVFFLVWLIGIICGIVGLVLSSVAWRRIASGSASPDGKGFAIAGFVTSLIAVAVAVIMFFAIASVLSSGY